LHWIGLQNSAEDGREGEAFVRHAEQVALLGVLTAAQAADAEPGAAADGGGESAFPDS